MIYSCWRHGSNLPSHSQSLPASSCLARHKWKVNRQMGSQIKLQYQPEDLSVQMNSSQRQAWSRTQLMRWQMQGAEYSFHSWKGKVSQSCGLSWRSTPSVQPPRCLGQRCSIGMDSLFQRPDFKRIKLKLLLSPRFGCTTTQGGVCNKQCHSDCKMKPIDMSEHKSIVL